MATYRERRLAKAERLREWSGGNATKGNAARAESDRIADMIPFGQPILVGHHSERRHRKDIERIRGGMDRAMELGQKAARQESAADEIEAQAANAIYDDDPDAIERLAAKLQRLEAEREQIKTRRAELRKEHRERLKGLTAGGREDVMRAAGVPQYRVTNLGGQITQTRDRLARLRRERVQGPRDRMITARFTSECAECGATLEKGQQIRYNRQQGARCCECQEVK